MIGTLRTEIILGLLLNTAIQDYRRERGITDATIAIGERPKVGIDPAAQGAAQRRFERSSAALAFISS